MLLYKHEKLLVKEKKQFKIRSKNKKTYFVDYLKKGNYKDVRDESLDRGIKSNVIGFTSFKRAKDNDSSVKMSLLVGNEKYVVKQEKPSLHSVVGYIKVDAIEDAYAANDKNISETYIAKTAVNPLPLLALIPIILLIIFCFSKCGGERPASTFSNNKPENVSEQGAIAEQQEKTTKHNKNVVDDNAELWDGEYTTNENSIAGSNESIELFGYTRATIDKDHPYVNLINPQGNTVYFKYVVKNENGEVLYTTDLIPPNKFVKWNAIEKLPIGTHQITLELTTFDLQTQNNCNGATLPLVVIVK